MSLAPLQTTAAVEIVAPRARQSISLWLVIAAWCCCCLSAAAAGVMVAVALRGVGDVQPFATSSKGIIAPLRLLDDVVVKRMLAQAGVKP